MYFWQINSEGMAEFVYGILADLLSISASETAWMHVEVDKQECVSITGGLEVDMGAIVKFFLKKRGSWSSPYVLYLLPHLSIDLELIVIKQNIRYKFAFENGELVSESRESCKETDRFMLRFGFDPVIWKFPFDFSLLSDRMERLAMLNPEIEILVRDVRADEPLQRHFHFPNGIYSLFEQISSKANFTGSTAYIQDSIGPRSYRIAIGFCLKGARRKSEVHAFCNELELNMPGSLHKGIRTGIQNAMRTHIQQKGLSSVGFFRATEMQKDLIVVVAMRTPAPILEGSTGVRLAMPDVQNEVSELVKNQLMAFFRLDPNRTSQILSQFGWNSDQR
jgi:DNA gyrase subunit B